MTLEPRPCGRDNCPIVDPSTIDRRTLRVHTLPAGTEWYRAARTEFGSNSFTPPGVGNGRFSPIADRGHCYLAEQRSAALLESALHEASGPNPRIYAAQLRRFSLYRLRLVDDVRLIDLRDPALAELGLDRLQLTGSTPLHYPCTQRVAEALLDTKRSSGLVWTSRQGALHADRNPDGLASEVLQHTQLDVAVLYQRPEARRSGVAVEVLDGEPLTVGNTPIRFVLELANLLRIAVL